MKCDIITPTYNRPKLLKRGIKSILNQTSPDWEHWIYDDGSDLDIKSVVTEFDDQRIHFIQGPKKTVAERFEKPSILIAKDILLKKSKNELIAYLDDDDYFWPEVIETAINYFKKFPERYVIYGKLTISDKNTENLPREQRQWRMFRHGMLNTCQVIHRRECLECWYVPEDMREYSEYRFHRKLIKKYEFFPVDFFLVNHWQHPLSMVKLWNTEKKTQRCRE